MTRDDVEKLRFNVKRPFRPVLKDAFLDAIFELMFIDNQIKSGIRPAKAAKMLQPVIRQLGLDRIEAEQTESWQTGEKSGREILVEEYASAAKLFVELGQDDKMYSKEFLKLTSLSDDKFKRKVKKDFGIIGNAVPEYAGMGEIFGPFREGLNLAYSMCFSEEY